MTHTARAAAAHAGVSWARRHLAIVTLIVVAPMLLVGCVGLMLFAGGSSPPPGCGQPYRATGSNDRILATIRTVESGGRYDVRITTSTASGAYAFIDAAWRHYAASVGVDISQYPSAWMAPPQAQDATANAYVNEILTQHAGDLTKIPLAWYLPAAIRKPELMDIVPPGGNVLTPRQYQARWLSTFERLGTTLSITVASSTPPVSTVVSNLRLRSPSLDHTSCSDDLAAGAYTAPPGVDSLPACRISWGGYAPGYIPTSAMRYSAHSGYMHPAASAAWDQLWSAARREGFNLDGSSYRPASQSSGATCSNHNWGLAIDIASLVSPDGFDTPAYRWLAANAHRYGYANPAALRPTHLGGTGRGGWAGGTCCHLEPWHWEFVAFLQLPPS